MCLSQSSIELMMTCSSWIVWQSLLFFLTAAKTKRQQPEATHSSRTSRSLSPVDGSVSSDKTDDQLRAVDNVGTGDEEPNPSPLSSTTSL